MRVRFPFSPPFSVATCCSGRSASAAAPTVRGARYCKRTATVRMFSYRDPRLGETLGDFDRAIEAMQLEPPVGEEARGGGPAGDSRDRSAAGVPGRRVRTTSRRAAGTGDRRHEDASRIGAPDRSRACVRRGESLPAPDDGTHRRARRNGARARPRSARRTLAPFVNDRGTMSSESDDRSWRFRAAPMQCANRADPSSSPMGARERRRRSPLWHRGCRPRTLVPPRGRALQSR